MLQINDLFGNMQRDLHYKTDLKKATKSIICKLLRRKAVLLIYIYGKI